MPCWKTKWTEKTVDGVKYKVQQKGFDRQWEDIELEKLRRVGAPANMTSIIAYLSEIALVKFTGREREEIGAKIKITARELFEGGYCDYAVKSAVKDVITSEGRFFPEPFKMIELCKKHGDKIKNAYSRAILKKV